MFIIAYIAGSNSFPHPLTSEEERGYLLEMKHEEGKKKELARNVLVERNLRLVAHIAKKYGSTTLNADDLISVGTIGLMKGITSYDLDKGTRLATYVARCIENEILMYIRTSKKRSVEVSLQEPIGVDKEGNEIMLIDIVAADKDSIADQVDLKMQIKYLYESLQKTLKGREKIVIEQRYGLSSDEKTQREIAESLDISRSYVSRIEKKALKKLHKVMSDS